MTDNKGRVLHVTCREHGRIWSEAVWCSHDIEEGIRHVVHAHAAPYGADCQSIVDVTVLDAETWELTQTTTHYPAGVTS